MTYEQIEQAIAADGVSDELFGLEQLPHIPDGSIMICYFIEPTSEVFRYLPTGAPVSPEGYWFVIHVYTNPTSKTTFSPKILYTKYGNESYRSSALETIFLMIEKDDKWFLVRDLSTKDKPCYVRQRSII